MNRLRILDKHPVMKGNLDITGNSTSLPAIVPASSQPKERLPRTTLEERQATLSHLVRMCARGYSSGLFVTGTGGSGKSRTITNVLLDEGIVPTLINSHITPLSLYRVLYENRTDRVVWLDDCDSIYMNMMVLGLLRSSLWGQGHREITYSSSQLEDIPNRFRFESRIIMCANSIPKNEAFQAVLSRVDTFDLSLSTEEAIEQMQLLANSGFRSLSPETCRRVIAFISKSIGNRRLSMRIYEPSLRKVEYAIQTGINWRDLVLSQLDQIGEPILSGSSSGEQLDNEAIQQVLQEHPESVALQQQRWCELRHKSRASFFRCKRRFDTSLESAK